MSDRPDLDEQDVMLADARHEDFGSQMQAPVVMPANHLMTPRQVGDLFGTLMTAQPVVQRRDHKQLMVRLNALAASFGDTYEYSWRVKDKNSKAQDGKTEVSGPTIKLAMDLSREYGNCAIDIREIESQTHWTFYARFTDLETGYTLTRAFRQRKNALQGKYEDDRKLDMAYQMGQSKASRNVVVNALSNYVDHMRTQAHKAALGAIAENPKKYLEGIDRGLEKLGIGLARAEALMGRVKKEWGTRDIAMVLNALKAVNDGMVDARDAFPQDGAQVPDAEETQTAGGSESPGESVEGAAATSSEAEPAAGDGSGKLHTAAAGDAEKVNKPKAAKAQPSPSPAPAATPAPQEPKKAPAKKPAALF